MDEADAKGVELALASTLEVAAAAAALRDPALGILAAGAVPAVVAAGGAVVERARHRAAAMVGLAADRIGESPEQLVERLSATKSRTTLMDFCLRAATTASWDGRLRALGHALATGALEDDDALVDEETYWCKILSELEAPDLRIIKYLDRGDPERPGYIALARWDELKEVSGYRSMIGPALQRMGSQGLIQIWDLRDVDPQSRGRWGFGTSGSVFGPGRLSKECLARFTAAAAMPNDLASA